MLCWDDALSIVQNAGYGQGFHAWQQLTGRYPTGRRSQQRLAKFKQGEVLSASMRSGILPNCLEEGSALKEHLVKCRRYRKGSDCDSMQKRYKEESQNMKKAQKIKRLDHCNYRNKVSEEKKYMDKVRTLSSRGSTNRWSARLQDRLSNDGPWERQQAKRQALHTCLL